MNIDRFKHQHVEILSGINQLRRLSHQGIADHAVDIAHALNMLARVVIQHLAIEDRILYPSLEHSGNERMARMGATYQGDMKGIANGFINFSRRWANATMLTRNPEGFRAEANTVLKQVHDRMLRENREFYPAIEAM
ncbi:MAG: hemerythrin domain-containing protein [Castellaniella sp.]|uniref:hemerythrin domain-containing protein n=1 Tax=Castellaniella sp. TaxID=1955812 RepID=UPI002A35BC22|nr:hemerythrin domain-containing protein [Castellaniella sp.]MDY0309529.1 hemerythrin domain-containing protein [Castellaniella sp.]